MRKNYIILILTVFVVSLGYGQLTAPFTESFSGLASTTPPAGWTVMNTSGTGFRFLPGTLINTVTCPNPGDATPGGPGGWAWCDMSGTNANNQLITPIIDVSALTVPRLTFQYYLCDAGYTPLNLLFVEAFNGTNWVEVDSIQQGTGGGWMEFGYNMSTFLIAGTDSIQVRFRAESGGSGNDFYGDNSIDEVRVFETPSCQYPGSLSSSNINSNSAVVSWLEGNAATEWQIEYDVAGFAQGTGNIFTTTTNPDTLTGLSDNTDYEFYVRALCAGNDTSLWVGPSSFRTTCNPFVAPYSQNWDALIPPALDACWTTFNPSAATNDRIVTYNGTAPTAFTVPNSVEMYNGSLGPLEDMVLVSPQFSDLDSAKQIRFQVFDESNTSDLVIGTVADPSDPSSFTPYVTLTEEAMDDDVWQEFTISFYDYDGTDQHIGFRHGANTTFDYIHVDDFFYEVQPAGCFDPSFLVAGGLTSSSVDLSWSSNGPATSWEIEYGAPGFALGTGTLEAASTNPHTLSGLSDDTPYDAYVRSFCANGDTSLWSEVVTFTTSCNAFTAPYEQLWDGEVEPDVNNCWTVWGVDAFPSARIVSYDATAPAAFSAPNSIEMYNQSSTPADTLALVSPQFTDLDNTKRIRFYVFDESNTSDLIVGTVADPNDKSTFTAYQTILETDMDDDVWQEITVSFDLYTGTDQYIAFKHGANTTFDYIHIDDFRYEVIPSCEQPTDVVFSNITNDGAIVSWTDLSGAASFEYNVVPHDSLPGVGLGIVGSGSNPAIVSGLMENTEYDFYVRAVCAPGDTSPWANPGVFFTLCTPFTAPYYQNWDAVTIPALDPCWRSIQDVVGTTASQVRTQSTFPAPFSPTNYAEIYNSGATGGDLFLITPQFSDLSSDKRIRFFAWDDNFTSDLIIGTMTDPADAFTYIPYDTLFAADMVNDAWEEYTIDFAGYTGGAAHIVFKHGLNTTFDYLHIDDFRYEVTPTCAIPSFLVAQGITDESANLAWTENGLATEWQISYGIEGFSVDTGIMVVTDSIPTAISGLDANTNYEFYVRALCAAMDTSPWANVGSFRSKCDPFTAPYVQNFDSTTAPVVDECWTILEELSNTTGEWIRTYSGNFPVAFSPSNSLEFNGSGTFPPVGALIAVTPRFSDMGNDKRIRFRYYDESNASDMYVGTLSDADDYTTFTPLDTLFSADYPAAWTEVIITFEDYTGTDQYIGFSHGTNTTFDYMEIDDFVYEDIPSCLEPLMESSGNYSATTADLFWDADSAVMEWEVQWDTTGFTFGSGNTDTVTSNPYTLTGLTASTTYDYYVRSICDIGVTSTWTPVHTFTTLCAPFTATYAQNFDATFAPAIDECWSVINTLPNGNPWIRTYNQNFPAANSPVNSIEMNSGSNTVANGGALILVSPQFSDFGPDKRIRFFAYDESNASDLIIGTLSDVADPSTFTPYFTLTEAAMADDVWEEHIISFDSYVGTDQFIGFMHGTNTTFDYIHIDDFVYEPIPFCPDPSFLTANFVGYDQAELMFTPSGANIVTHNYEIQPGTAAQGTPGAVATGTTATGTFTVTGLMEQTTYSYYIQTDCGTDSTGWVGPYTFTTICAPVIAPYCEGFDVASLPTCWEQGANNGEDWRFSLLPNTGHVGNVNNMGSATTESGGGFAWVDDSGAHNTETDLLTPLVDITGVNQPRLKFYFISNNEGQTNVDFSVAVWDGAMWNDVFFSDSNSVGGTWQEVIIPLDTFNITGPVQARFRVDENNGTGFYDDVAIDDVCIEGIVFNDAEVTSILSPINGCGEEFSTIEVVVTNNELDDMSDIPLVVNLSGIAAGTFDVVIPFIASGESDTILVDVFNSQAGGVATIEAYVAHALDEINANDTLSVDVTFDAIAVAATYADNTICEGDSVMYVNMDTSVSTVWTLAANDSIIFAGDTAWFAPTTTTMYGATQLASLSESVGSTMPPTTGFINYTGWGLRFFANENFILDDVTMYPNGTGTIDIAILDDATEVELMSTGLINITDGGTAYTPVVIPLDFAIPASVDDYRIVIKDGAGLVNMGRLSGTNPFPYVSPSGAVNIENGSTSAPGGTSNSYYWFFDWNITIAGCPSEETFFTISVEEATFDTTDIVACDSATLEGGDVVTMSGMYTDTLVGANGCARYATQNVTINNSTNDAVSASICGGSTYTLPDGTVVSDAGVYTTTLVGANGCDETTVTTVSVVTSYDLAQNVQICEGEMFTVGMNNYDATGTYVDSLTSGGGCDSIVTTNLVVNPLASVSISGIATVCEGTPAISLALSPAGGTLSGPGVTGSDFLAADAGLGTHTITYSYTGSNGCSASASIDVDVVVCTSIDDIDGIETVSIYPNPFAETINVMFEDASSESLKITLYDIAGRVILTKDVETVKGSNQISLNASSASAAGVYIIQLERNGATHQTRLTKVN